MIASIRLKCQQLSEPVFDRPQELVSWMGAIQAQDFDRVKWAVGLRLRSAPLRAVEEAMSRGEILRTHVMRPTWHLVAAGDIRWMLKLSARRIHAANRSSVKSNGLEFPESLCIRCTRELEKMLEGGRSLTKQQIGEELQQVGISVEKYLLTHLLLYAETEGIICSGADMGRGHTYALLGERVPPTAELHHEEALARLATAYFRSHSPAGLDDFAWWSGLTAKEVREAVGLIDADLVKERFGDRELFVHRSCDPRPGGAGGLHFLPPFDEYLISYKTRTDVLAPEHHARAFNRFGTFYPVILCDGRIVGNWRLKPASRKKPRGIETSFFSTDLVIDSDRLIVPAECLLNFLTER